MPALKKDPLRPLRPEERSHLERLSRALGLPATLVARAKVLLAVANGYAPEANVITCVMVESPRLCFDDVSQDPIRLLTGLAVDPVEELLVVFVDPLTAKNEVEVRRATPQDARRSQERAMILLRIEPRHVADQDGGFRFLGAKTVQSRVSMGRPGGGPNSVNQS